MLAAYFEIFEEKLFAQTIPLHICIRKMQFLQCFPAENVTPKFLKIST